MHLAILVFKYEGYHRVTTDMYRVFGQTSVFMYISRSNFKARLQNCEKRLLALSRLSVCPHGTNRLPLLGFS
jgi:hypothetical protein